MSEVLREGEKTSLRVSVTAGALFPSNGMVCHGPLIGHVELPHNSIASIVVTFVAVATIVVAQGEITSIPCP